MTRCELMRNRNNNKILPFIPFCIDSANMRTKTIHPFTYQLRESLRRHGKENSPAISLPHELICPSAFNPTLNKKTQLYGLHRAGVTQTSDTTLSLISWNSAFASSFSRSPPCRSAMTCMPSVSWPTSISHLTKIQL